MLLHPIQPKDALNQAYRKVKPFRNDIEAFRQNLLYLISQVDDAKDEENHKTEMRDFLKKTYFGEEYHFNVKQNIDWAIFNGPKSSDSVGVIIEAKRPTNKAEMVTKDNLNRKAFHELILYYLRERITAKNLEVRHLIITNIHEWFIFDAQVFEKLFAQNKGLVKQFDQFESKQLSASNTSVFYNDIAKPFLDKLETEITFTHFDLKDYETVLKKGDSESNKKLIALYKIFSPEHLLKLNFANDSNSLNKEFYKELLHIIGLEDKKEGGKHIIQRKAKGQRDEASLLENTIKQLDKRDLIFQVEKPIQYGASKEDQLFGVALELVITWVNRVLFLKLLEAQLISYNKDKAFAFLNANLIHDYDDLDDLFFGVLAKKPEERDEENHKKFGQVPYLNSSLFESTTLEASTLYVGLLRDERQLPLHNQTVLKDNNGKRKGGELSALHYLFAFLDAYDFSSENGEEIQEEKKTLINASVLGLIFEKINGYKDGSFFTPGFITMYMCRETIRRAVLQRFKNDFGIEADDIDDLYSQLDRKKKPEYNAAINSLKICDPAVGSGHFLVSALNELIAIKSELEILIDKEGKPLRDCTFEVINDELIIKLDDELFQYNPKNPTSQRIQETIFHEKQTIIENCLFGVDINPNSVKICRLRLWIELLKHAYYRQATEPSKGFKPLEGYDKVGSYSTLETLPNIDINIKCGNSLISRFGLDEDLSRILKSVKWNIETYKGFVLDYKHASNKEEKKGLEKLIEQIKSDFRSEIARDNPIQRRLDKLGYELFKLTGKGKDGFGLMMFDPEEDYGKDKLLKKKREAKIKKLEKDIAIEQGKLDEIKSNKIYQNAFEWRFEFPEVLNHNGDFLGFDVVIGNPPYIRQEAFSADKPYLQQHYQTAAGTADLFVYFVERGMNVLAQNGQFIYILPNKWMRAGYGKNLRNWVGQFSIESIVDFGDLPVFEEATTYPCIWHMSKTANAEPNFKACTIESLEFDVSLGEYVKQNQFEVNQSLLPENGWTLVDDKIQRLLEKIKNQGAPLGEYVEGKIYRGVLTGYNEAFVIDEATKNQLIEEDPKSAEIIKPFLAGRDIKRYQQPKSDKYLILFKNGDTKKWFGDLDEEKAWEKLQEKFPSISSFLKQFEVKAKARYDQGHYWWELRACDYYEEFEKPKVMLPDISIRCEALYDEGNFYCVNTAYIMPTLKKSDLGLLNSGLVLFFYGNITQTIRGGYYRFIRQYLEQIPMVDSTSLESKVDQILSLKKENPQADTSALEREIDLMVYELYGLSEEEIKIIEES
ncbi:MAG: type II restriction endonuclease [Cytophagales bacterium CG12_big_fil_rev_8_21_14_0_65_40_12]|nr:MAG: type II restriction endonuclease [Cytophagales bacterium CG12_big_fil_rev_8_21_14_0_65_40_12]PIW05847.1 MAG: type II restriction endonuclease [Cytophagales bacterium CG17_big_fil_post_rev_8_21_14_2_50_40_13]